MAKTHVDDTNQALTMIEMLMVKEAKALLQKTVLKELDSMMDAVAIEAVRKFTEIETSKSLTPFGEELHIHFSRKVINQIKEGSTVVVHEEKVK